MDQLISAFCYVKNLKLSDYNLLVSNWNGESTSLSSLVPSVKGSAEDGLKTAEMILKICKVNSISIIDPRSEFYPDSFRQLFRPPVFLTFIGDPNLLRRKSISIVGSREPASWVEHWMERELLTWLRKSTYQVVSGGARGIDQKAHQLGIRSGSTSLGFLPSGILRLYPKSLKVFIKPIDSGKFGFLSEYPPDLPMKKYHFYRRNQLIAVFSPQLLIMQAHIKSGTMMTAQYGIQQHRCILTLPGVPGDPSFSGNLQLLYDGAELIRSAPDLDVSVH